MTVAVGQNRHTVRGPSQGRGPHSGHGRCGAQGGASPAPTIYDWLSSYEFCAFAPLDGASPVPTIYGWMASNEFCHIHYTLVWAELQDLLDKSCGEILRLAQDDTGMQLRLMLIRVDNGNEQYSRDIVKATEGR